MDRRGKVKLRRAAGMPARPAATDSQGRCRAALPVAAPGVGERRRDDVVPGREQRVVVGNGGEIAPGFACRMPRQRRDMIGLNDQRWTGRPCSAAVSRGINLQKHLKILSLPDAHMKSWSISR